MSNYVETTSEKTFDNSFWSILREAFSGSSRDFTKDSIGLGIFLLAVPMILEMFMESVFAVVDIYFVGHLGANSVAIVGLTESIMAIIYAVAIGLSVGATATVARRYGEQDKDGAAKSAAHAIMLGVVVSLLMSVVGIVFAPLILRLLGAEQAIISEGTTFMRIMLGGNAVVVFLFLLNAIFRGAGDAAIAMRVLFLANLLNIILAPCFIYGPDIFAFFGIDAPQWLIDNWIFPHLGVTGAAVGTTIGRGIGVLFAAYWLVRPGGRITIHKEHWQIDRDLLLNLLKIAMPAVLQFTIATASWSVLVAVVAGFGNAAIAGYVIGLRVIVFALLPAAGLSNAAATLVGQNLGAEKPERAEKAVWIAAFVNVAFLGLVGLLLLFFSDRVIRIFTDEPEVIAYGTNALHIVAYGFIFYALGMVLESAFNGAGDTWTPTFLNLFIFWVFEIPLAYILSYKFGFGPDGVFWAITIAFSLFAVVAALIFKQGKWKLKVV
ncbi:MAG: MATE family efflux transporter [Pyrinomonadaceae bacterium]|nr:MATE family efflux transporter [Pyrinomonadaceae bacterium]